MTRFALEVGVTVDNSNCWHITSLPGEEEGCWDAASITCIPFNPRVFDQIIYIFGANDLGYGKRVDCFCNECNGLFPEWTTQKSAFHREEYSILPTGIGVLQGSVTAPTLFLIYINSLLKLPLVALSRLLHLLPSPVLNTIYWRNFILKAILNYIQLQITYLII